MIDAVAIRGFKRFDEVRFTLPDHVVVAGPNNAGKTTLLQAIAAWSLALRRWQEQNDFQRHGTAYARVPIARQAFSAAPVRSFDLLWRDRDYKRGATIEIELRLRGCGAVAMELIGDSTEQIYVRPKADVEPARLPDLRLDTVFVPAMTGLSIEEPVYQVPMLDHLLGQARPGEVLRNVLLQASQQGETWEALNATLGRLFHFTLLPPSAPGAHIRAEYQSTGGGPALDIASAGSGFQQVVMLLAFLYTRPVSVLLLDEPDAHLHLILQSAIFGELRRVAAEQSSQLVIATHSEVIINSVDPRELCVLIDGPRMLADSQERAVLIRSLGVLSHEDILRALEAPGVLYLEDYTDLEILREWAEILAHPARDFLAKPFWKRTVHQATSQAPGVQARDHFAALQLGWPGIPGLELVDGDAHPDKAEKPLTGEGLQRLRWRRYEIESYLVQPAVLERFVVAQVGEAASGPAVEDLHQHLAQQLPPAILADPLADHPFLNNTKARSEILPPALDAAGLPGFPYTRYREIAAVMLADEIHPEIAQKLDAIAQVFGL